VNAIRRVALAVLVWLLPSPLHAMQAVRPSVAAVRSTGALRIDGVLDEPDWGRATPITDFRLLFGLEGKVPSESTEVRVLFDEHRIVFGIVCHEAHAPSASVVPRDHITDGDHIAVHLDTDGDGQRAYIFGVNAYGVQLDGTLTDEPDFQWDGVWDAEARREPGRWTAEIAIPFRTLRFAGNGARPWRLWIRRQCDRLNEVSSWPLWKQGEAGNIMLQAADLTGLEGVRSGHAVYLEPYVFGTLDGVRSTEGGVAGGWTDSRRRAAGLDAQAAVTSELTLNATLRPDFSQIESDALLIDLNQRFPLQYPEKRPFFLEGGDVFASPLDMVYTRRMANPTSGVKVAGRVGALRTGALWVRDDGGVSMAGSGYGPDADSRRGNFVLSRLELPLGNGNAVALMGGMHEQDDDRPGRSQTPGAWYPDGSRNLLLSADATLRFSDRWSWVGQLAQSATRIDSTFADTAVFVPGLPSPSRRQSFDGGIWVSRLRYDDRAYSLYFGVRNVAPRFRDELGFQERIGVRYQNVVAEWRVDPKGGPLQRVKWTGDALVLHGEKNGVEFVDLNPWVDFQFRRNFDVSLGFDAVDEYWLGRHYAQERVHTWVTDLRWRPLTWSLETIVGDGIYYGETDAESWLAWTETWLLDASIRPAPGLTVAANVKHFRVARTATSGEVIDLWLAGLNANAQLSRRLSTRLYPQYDSDTRHLALNGLVGWVLHPGTVLYAGVNGGFDELGPRQRLVTTTRQVFAKASWRFER
jgi:hypothetical protein